MQKAVDVVQAYMGSTEVVTAEGICQALASAGFLVVTEESIFPADLLERFDVGLLQTMWSFAQELTLLTGVGVGRTDRSTFLSYIGCDDMRANINFEQSGSGFMRDFSTEFAKLSEGLPILTSWYEWLEDRFRNTAHFSQIQSFASKLRVAVA